MIQNLLEYLVNVVLTSLFFTCRFYDSLNYTSQINNIQTLVLNIKFEIDLQYNKNILMEHLESTLMSNLERFLNEKYGDHFSYEASNYDFIEVYAYNKVDKKDKYCLIRIGVLKDYKQIHIPNVYIPEVLKHNGIGKKMIFIVFVIGLQFNYDVFVVDLTDAFRERLLKRGALETGRYDILQIVKGTRLTF